MFIILRGVERLALTLIFFECFLFDVHLFVEHIFPFCTAYLKYSILLGPPILMWEMEWWNDGIMIGLSHES